MQRPLWSTAPSFAIQRQASLMARGDKLWSSEHLCHPETSESDGTHRPLWSFAPSFAIQRQASPIARRDKLWLSAHLCYLETSEFDGMQRQIWSSAPFCRRLQCLSTETIIVSLCLPETSKSDGMQRPLWSSAPFLLSRDKQVWWHAETIMVIHSCCFWEYFSFFFHPETIKSYGTQRHIMVICPFYISKTTMPSVIACVQMATMSSFAFRRRQYLQSLHAFKRRQCLHVHFEDNNVFSHCMPSVIP